MLNKSMPKFFLIKSHSLFYCNNSSSFESIFCIKAVKTRLFKKYLKKKKIGGTIQFVISVGAEAHKVGKIISFWPNFDTNFTDIRRAWNGKLNIL